MPTFSYHTFRKQLKEGRYRDAAWYARKAADRTSPEERIQWYIHEASAWLRDNCADEALKAAESVCTLSPEHSDGFYLQAVALFLLGKTDEAFSSFTRAAELGGDPSLMRKGRTDCLIRLQRFDEAFSEHSATDGGDALHRIYTIRILKGLGRFDDALHHCDMLMADEEMRKVARWLQCDLELHRDGIEATRSRYDTIAATTGRDRTLRELCTHLARLSQQPSAPKERRDYFSILMKHAFTLAKTGREMQALPKFEEVLLALPSDRYCNNSYPAAARRVRSLGTARDFYRILTAFYPEERIAHGILRKLCNEIEMLSSQ